MAFLKKEKAEEAGLSLSLFNFWGYTLYVLRPTLLSAHET
jgi:hypothetical protein